MIHTFFGTEFNSIQFHIFFLNFLCSQNWHWKFVERTQYCEQKLWLLSGKYILDDDNALLAEKPFHLCVYPL